MPGSRARINERILKGKSKASNRRILDTQSFPISEADLISTEKVSRGFYNGSVKRMSDKLLLPIATDSLGLVSNSSKRFFQHTEPNSWFSIRNHQCHMNEKLPKISLLSTPSILPDCKEQEPQKTKGNEKVKVKVQTTTDRKIKAARTKETNGHKLKKNEKVLLGKLKMKCLPIRLYFDFWQMQVLKRWFGCARFFYNRAIKDFVDDENKIVPKLDVLRLRYSHLKSEDDTLFLKALPYNSMEGALARAIATMNLYKTNLAKEFAKHALDNQYRIKEPKLKFLSRKDISQIMKIRVQNISDDFKIYPSILFEGKSEKYFDRHFEISSRLANLEVIERRSTKHVQDLRRNSVIPPREDWSDSTLKWNRMTNEWNLFLTYSESVPETQGDNPLIENDNIQIVSIDPGVKTFATLYSPSSNLIAKVGNNDYNRLYRLKLSQDKMQSALSELKGQEKRRKRRRYKRVIHRIGQRIKNLRKDLHNKLASWLVEKFDVIIIPPFNESNSCIKSRTRGGKLRKETKRHIQLWAHCIFRSKLIMMAEDKGKKVIIQEEHYTSKTCTNCGWIHNTLGNKDVFCCRKEFCSIRIDRDVNGARNIMLRAFSDECRTDVFGIA